MSDGIFSLLFFLSPCFFATVLTLILCVRLEPNCDWCTRLECDCVECDRADQANPDQERASVGCDKRAVSGQPNDCNGWCGRDDSHVDAVIERTLNTNQTETNHSKPSRLAGSQPSKQCRFIGVIIGFAKKSARVLVSLIDANRMQNGSYELGGSTRDRTPKKHSNILRSRHDVIVAKVGDIQIQVLVVDSGQNRLEDVRERRQIDQHARACINWSS